VEIMVPCGMMVLNLPLLVSACVASSSVLHLIASGLLSLLPPVLSVLHLSPIAKCCDVVACPESSFGEGG